MYTFVEQNGKILIILELSNIIDGISKIVSYVNIIPTLLVMIKLSVIIGVSRVRCGLI